jgi:hypothetical protein
MEIELVAPSGAKTWTVKIREQQLIGWLKKEQ